MQSGKESGGTSRDKCQQCADTNAVSVNLPSSGSLSYDGNGNMTNDGAFSYEYDDENQLTRIRGVTWETEFVYDGKMRRRIARQYENPEWPLITGESLSTTIRSNFDGWVGFRFTVGSSPIVVTELGRWVLAGNSASHAVKLVSSNGVDIAGASVTVNTTGAKAGAFAYAPLASRVTLAANTTYYLVSQEVYNENSWYEWNRTVASSSAATVKDGAWAVNNSTTYGVAGSTGNTYGPPSLLYQTSTNAALTSETRYVYDGMLPIQERDGNNVPLVTYTRGRDLSGSLQGAGGIGGLLARTDHGLYMLGLSSAHAYYHADGNGNVTALINDKQNIVARYSYDPYGNTLSLSGPLADANTYRFSSKEIYRNTGLYYYGYRFYNPNLQRRLNRDPISERGEPNLYQFALNSPVNGIDPLGLWYVPPTLVVGPAPAIGIVGGCAVWAFGKCVDLWPMPDPGPLPLPPNKQRPKPPGFPRPKPPTSCNAPLPKPSFPPVAGPSDPAPFDPSIPDNRDDLRECHRQAQDFDNFLYRRNGKGLSDEEFNEYVKNCMKEKGYSYPP